MPGRLEIYRGHHIIWDVRPLASDHRWKAQAAVVLPTGPSGIPAVQAVAGSSQRFGSLEEAQDFLLRAARSWIDNRLEREAAEQRP